MAALFLRKSSLLATLVLVLGSCAFPSFDAEKRAAETAVATFHARYNAEQWHEIFQHTHPHFGEVTTEADFTRLLTIVHQKIGNVTGSKLTHGAGKAYPDSTNIVLDYETQWERGKGVEQFEFEVQKGKAALTKYMCNSPQLLLNK